MAYPHTDKLLEKLWPSNAAGDTSLYVILDSARNDDIYPAVMDSQCEFECLYMGELEPDVAEAAPYLIKLEQDKPFTEWLLKEACGSGRTPLRTCGSDALVPASPGWSERKSPNCRPNLL